MRDYIDRIILEHLNINSEAQIRTIKLTKNQGYELLRWLYKNHRKLYYNLAATYINHKKSRKMKDKLFADYGSHGYLPGFSDEPDYYYIYC